MSSSLQSSDDSASSNIDLEQIFVASRSALCILRGPEHRWEKVNTVYQDLIFPGIALIGRTVHEVIPDADAQGFGLLLDQVYATGQPQYGHEVRLEVNDRAPMYFNFVYAAIYDARGAISGIFVEAHDVTMQVQTRQALEAAEANYRSIFEHAAEGIFRTSPDGRLRLVNPALARIFGYASPDEMREQMSFGVEYLYADSAQRSALLSVLAQQDLVNGFVVEARRKDDTPIWLSLSVHVLRHPDGTIQEYEGIAEDITDRQQAEQALRASESRSRTLLAHFPNGAVFLFDHHLRYTFASGSGLAASGLSAEMFEGKTIWEIFPPEIAARDEPYLRAALEGTATQVETSLGSATFVVHTLPVRDDHGMIVGGMVMTQDISERKHAEAERERLLHEAEQARQEAEAAVHVRDQFLSIASHELRTPLTSLLGYASMLQTRLGAEVTTDAVTQRQTDAIVRQVTRLNGLIGHLLDVTRLQQGQFNVELQPIDLGTVVVQAVEAFRLTLPDGPGQVISIHVPDVPTTVLADPSRLEEILYALLGNAVKYSGAQTTVEVRITARETEVIMDVIDQGIGIPVEAQTHLFEAFYRAGNVSPTSSGFGLGLYVVYELVQHHGGRIEVESAEGQGSTFRVILPLVTS